MLLCNSHSRARILALVPLTQRYVCETTFVGYFFISLNLYKQNPFNEAGHHVSARVFLQNTP